MYTMPRGLGNSPPANSALEKPDIGDSTAIIKQLIDLYFYDKEITDRSLEQKYPAFYALARKKIEDVSRETIEEERKTFGSG